MAAGGDAGAVGLRDPIHVVSKARPASELALRQPFCGMSCGLRGRSRQIINRLSVHSGGSQCSALLLCPRFRQEHFLSAAPSSDPSCAITMCQVNLRPGEWLLAGPCGRPIALKPGFRAYHCESCDVGGSDEPAIVRATIAEQKCYLFVGCDGRTTVEHYVEHNDSSRGSAVHHGKNEAANRQRATAS
jgi:hypothetical protein